MSDDTWAAAFVFTLWLGAMAWGIGFIVRYI
ncbi:hypothetical protein J2R95_003204 [Bradyrhizobium japonicum]|nr:hypothetical protein [Bradyrhizobium japonicum]